MEKHLIPGRKILDLGTGSGALAELLRARGYKVTGIDVANRVTFGSDPIIYDGKTLPFKDYAFDHVLLITVLHHCQYPERILEEAARVSRDKVFVLEDIYDNKVMEFLTKTVDSLVNFEFLGHPHTNKTRSEWESHFRDLGLRIAEEESLRLMGIFWQIWYVLSVK
nr:class I SAM-dependent methyltransferase [Saprospiraceae bacterium]